MRREGFVSLRVLRILLLQQGAALSHGAWTRVVEEKKGDEAQAEQHRSITRRVIRAGWVSMTETREVKYFIDHRLNTRKRAVNDDTRNQIAHKLKDLPGKAPHKRDEVNAWLDGKYGLSTV